jgi:hypothetical protein
MSETILSYRPRLSDDGRLVLRLLSRNELMICVTNMLSHEAALLVQAPATWRGALEAFFVGLRELQGRLYVSPVAAAPAPAAPPEALADLGSPEELLSLRWVNNELDRLISDLASLLSVQGRRGSSAPKRDAAQALWALWFAEGRGFLTLESQLQWAETSRRFDGLSGEVKEALTLLDLEGQVEDIAGLNGWFGRLLGISPEQGAASSPQPPAEAAPLEADAAEVFNQALCLANLAWPGTSEAAVSARRLLLGTWLDFVAAGRLR